MSSGLVDYGSSDDDEEVAEEFPLHAVADAAPAPAACVSLPTSSLPNRNVPSVVPTEPSLSPAVRLPDAADLFGESSSSLLAATALSSSRKRPEVNGSAHLAPPKKIARGNLPASRITPDTAGGLLLPPQLRGRSNVVTDDLDKLFVRRNRKGE